MMSTPELASAKEHYDVMVFLLLLLAAGLFGTSMYIFRKMNSNMDKLAVVTEQLDKRLDKVERCQSAISTAHAINHNQKIEC